MMRPSSAFVNIAALSARKQRLLPKQYYSSSSLTSLLNSNIHNPSNGRDSGASRRSFTRGGISSRHHPSFPSLQQQPGRPITTTIAAAAASSADTASSHDSNGEDDKEKHDKFFQMEHRNWEQGYEEYDTGFGPLTQQTIPTLLANAGYPPSSSSRNNHSDDDTTFRVLDVATGPGFVLSAAMQMASTAVLSLPDNSDKPTFQLTGLDITQNFLSMAKQRIHAQQQQQNDRQSNQIQVNFVQGNAESLPFPDNTFNSIVCNFGILHFFQPDSFLRESYRVLRPGGKVSFSCWAPPARTEGFGITLQSITEVGNPNVAVPEGPNFFRFGEVDESRRTLEGIGFVNVGATELSDMKWNNVRDGTMLYHILSNGTVRTKEILLGQTKEEAVAVEAMVVEKYNLVTEGGKRPLAMPAVVSSGQKPV